jgi:hypothetical protein
VEEHTSLVLTFTPPGSDELVQIHAHIAWVNSNGSPVSSKHPEGFGLRFENLSEKDQDLLDNFLKRNYRSEKATDNIIYPKQFAK